MEGMQHQKLEFKIEKVKLDPVKSGGMYRIGKKVETILNPLPQTSLSNRQNVSDGIEKIEIKLRCREM